MNRFLKNVAKHLRSASMVLEEREKNLHKGNCCWLKREKNIF
jgi:hypothetical protein